MKKAKLGCLSIALILIGILLFGVNPPNKETENYSSTTVDLKEFDSKSWEQYKSIYDAHNKLMKAMNAYSNGNVSDLEFYDYCKDAESYFSEISTNFDYGSTKDQKTYLSVFENLALSDQLVSQNLMKYLDSSEIKYLSKAQEYIKRASDAAIMIASNRSKLLKDAGYTQEEIKKIIDNIPNELAQ